MVNLLHKVVGVALLGVIGVLPVQAAEYLPKPQLKTVYAATFEVVVKKIGEGQVKYEKPLPIDRLPYHIRNDDYWSIGTAFAIAPNSLITAAHVFMLGRDSQYKEYFVRDSKGRVFELGHISKYSGKKDFVSFTLKNHKVEQYYKLNTNTAINELVFSVGNALGEGVVIRDGLYTSKTPEQDKGEWNWIRFSAAASPGNSGGPLLDKQGRVVGVVVRKSENENLNYALPIQEVLNSPENIATDDALYRYNIDNMEFSKTDRLLFKTKLPLSFQELSEKLVKSHNEFTSGLYEQMQQENASHIFPNGDGARNILHKTYAAEFPQIIWQKGDRTWAPYKPSEVRKANLGNNGTLHLGTLRSTLLLKFRKPDSMPTNKFLFDAEALMDLMLKGIPVNRTIAGEKVRIVSLGKPSMDEVYQDNYQRKWLVRSWNIPYDDSVITILSLPTPNGNISLLRRSGTSEALGHLSDLKVLTDFLYLSYYGTLSEWDEFLARKDIVPQALKNVSLTYKPGRVVQFKSNSVSFSYNTDLMKITDTSDIYLNMSYMKHDDKVVWDIARIAVGEEANSGRYFDITMNIKPSEQMDDSDKSNWKKLANREFPYNGESYFKNRSTSITALYPDEVSKAENVNRPTLYSVSYSIDGKIEQQAAADKLNSFMKTLKIQGPQ